MSQLSITVRNDTVMGAMIGAASGSCGESEMETRFMKSNYGRALRTSGRQAAVMAALTGAPGEHLYGHVEKIIWFTLVLRYQRRIVHILGQTFAFHTTFWKREVRVGKQRWCILKSESATKKTIPEGNVPQSFLGIWDNSKMICQIQVGDIESGKRDM
ncbi:hypothetical protein BT63DRAFT_481820 [Microthyrium microscopicum]|uniref:Uncharacterized protein n=1 Tax=Microthyrium microscopicum TaxID=703497 RepID=A0A6A6U264_9PEZI|nr:hypothetical protein BT63DRAFT_481820 [Microthyrium microscopicum]